MRRLAMQWQGYYWLKSSSDPRVLGPASGLAACNKQRAEADAALDSQELGRSKRRTAGKSQVDTTSQTGERVDAATGCKASTSLREAGGSTWDRCGSKS